MKRSNYFYYCIQSETNFIVFLHREQFAKSFKTNYYADLNNLPIKTRFAVKAEQILSKKPLRIQNNFYKETYEHFKHLCIDHSEPIKLIEKYNKN